MLPRCMVCGYDATGLPEQARCPECGASALDRNRRRPKWPASLLALTPYGVLPLVAIERGVVRSREDAAECLFSGALVALIASVVIGIVLRVLTPLRWRSSDAGVWATVFLGTGLAVVLSAIGALLGAG